MPFNTTLLSPVLVKKFVDRLEKSYKEHGFVAKRTAVQEDVAKMLGFASYYELNQQMKPAPSQENLSDRIAQRRQGTFSSRTGATTIFESKVLPLMLSALGGVPTSINDTQHMIARFATAFDGKVLQYNMLALEDKQKFAQEVFAHYASPDGVFPIEKDFRCQNAAFELLDTIVRRTPELEKSAVVAAYFDLVPHLKPDVWPVFVEKTASKDTSAFAGGFSSSVLAIRIPAVAISGEGFEQVFAQHFAPVKASYAALALEEKIQFIHEFLDFYKGDNQRMGANALDDVLIAIAKATPKSEQGDAFDALSGMDRVRGMSGSRLRR